MNKKYRIELFIPQTPRMVSFWATIRNEPDDAFGTGLFWLKWFREKNEEYGGDSRYRLIEITEKVLDEQE